MIKLQAGFDDICRAITEVKNGFTFYSPLAEKIIKDIEKYKTEQQDILDTVDKHIIFYLNKHFTHAEISKKIGKSESTIEKRKRKMKSIFGLEEDSDANLLSHAKDIGFLDGFRE
ncbi:hypothetical protein CHRY9390_01596 [Chryseobacterium aquaeductus]|uniref:Uncharacterized protein n=1 Tax=Chryseobacterium aquaeductus TaxID=2675056 RepID=A0A9N8MGV4_9FLAO|nr:hypothetical protein [Chryseobacterium aquaeductus]CAA7330917.1 hypothetical protein CHRY9390_01596 [Chryseobacterium potabilaquae]CAD7806997.1 hypothetical protein CHRY9390_01596 [Chryseobacterium aquaeductus]